MASKKVRVAIIGVGNCASSLVQGVHYYRNAKDADSVPGLMHVNLGGYHIKDIEFTLGIDINATKVGKDLSEAIFAYPNNTYKFTDVPKMNVPVVRGMTHDGLGKYLSEVIERAPGPTADIVGLLYRPSATEEEEGDTVAVNLCIAKSRNGPTGDVRLVFLKHYTRFESVARMEEA